MQTTIPTYIASKQVYTYSDELIKIYKCMCTRGIETIIILVIDPIGRSVATPQSLRLSRIEIQGTI